MQRKGAYLALVLILCLYVTGCQAPKPLLGSAGQKPSQIADQGGSGENGHRGDDDSGKGQNSDNGGGDGENDGGNGQGNGGKSSSAKKFVIQDTSQFAGKNGFIGDDHVSQQDFSVYVFVTNGGQTQNVDAPWDVKVTLTLMNTASGQESKTYPPFIIPKGSACGTVLVQVPKAGTWYLQADGNPGKGEVTVDTNDFSVGAGPAPPSGGGSLWEYELPPP
ncbi:hypothetical protein CEB3_c45740 [Peptococcaceae bacterium CEB3]|nr:hypothetical protein CEB3_c45740 [Peptococcaceae bacterium CEB3]